MRPTDFRPARVLVVWTLALLLGALALAAITRDMRARGDFGSETAAGFAILLFIAALITGVAAVTRLVRNADLVAYVAAQQLQALEAPGGAGPVDAAQTLESVTASEGDDAGTPGPS